MSQRDFLDIYGDPTLVGIVFDNPSSPKQFLTDTKHLQLPINCVLNGQQREPVSKLMGLDGAITGPLKGIFGE